MRPKRIAPSPLTWWVAALIGMPVLGWAQPADTDAAQAWRQANDLVGQFRRGHIDLLKWETAHPPAKEALTSSEAVLALPSSEAAVRKAWQLRPDCAGTLNRLSAADRDRVARGEWGELDPAWARRADGFDELLDFTAQVRKAWLQAASSALALAPTRAALDAAQVASELGQRMVNVGNWSRLVQAPQRLAWANAQLDWQRARVTARQDQARLLKLLGQNGRYDGVGLPDALPAATPVPSQLWFDERLQRLQGLYGGIVSAGIRGDARLAYENLIAASATAQASDDIVKTRDMVLEETQLHYSGMLKSTWDLLAEVQNLAQAQIAALNAQRDAELARIDLDRVLLGVAPDAAAALNVALPSGGE